jgi:hypothetical protein
VQKNELDDHLKVEFGAEEMTGHQDLTIAITALPPGTDNRRARRSAAQPRYTSDTVDTCRLQMCCKIFRRDTPHCNVLVSSRLKCAVSSSTISR